MPQLRRSDRDKQKTPGRVWSRFVACVVKTGIVESVMCQNPLRMDVLVFTLCLHVFYFQNLQVVHKPGTIASGRSHGRGGHKATCL